MDTTTPSAVSTESLEGRRKHDHAHSHHHHHGLESRAGLAVQPGVDALIGARGLWLTRSGRTILEDIDLDIGRGEIVTLIGPNGAGKTTLVRVLLGLTTPDRGEVHRSPGLSIGYVPQRFDIDRAIPMTVVRFLALGGSSTPDRIRAIMEEVGASHVLDQQIAGLSGGELQRVLLARALLRDPNLLVLDEPVRGVDYAGEAELYTLIGRLRDDRALSVLLVSHDLHIVMAQSDRVICVNRHVCCSGVPETVARDPSYIRLFGAHAARAFAIYSHQHDHRHDLAGEARPVAPDAAVTSDGQKGA